MANNTINFIVNLNGNYYVVATDVKFSSSGGCRTITIGKKIG
ncbi:MAG: hypothetical protein ACI392_02660 [Paludibacteraceae bacterium]